MIPGYSRTSTAAAGVPALPGQCQLQCMPGGGSRKLLVAESMSGMHWQHLKTQGNQLRLLQIKRCPATTDKPGQQDRWIHCTTYRC